MALDHSDGRPTGALTPAAQEGDGVAQRANLGSELDEPATDAAAAIRSAAYRLLAERGYAHVGLREIAAAAGVALSQVHYYYQSKEGLLLAVTREVTRRHLQALQQRLAGVEGVEGRIRAAIAYIQEKLRQDPGWFRLYFDLLGLALWNPKVAAAARALQAEIIALICAQAGAACDPDQPGAAAAARVVLGALDGLALQALLSQGVAAVDPAYGVLEGLLEVLARGQGAAGGEAGGGKA